MRRAAAGALLGVLGLLAAAPALADQTITAGPLPNTYSSASFTIAQGEAVTFQNSDQSGALHDVTADTKGADGQPLFKSKLIEKGQTAPVVGVEYLTTGDYAFHCSVHTFMKATLRVSASGTPKPRTPEQPAASSPTDTTPPAASVSILDGRIGPVLARGKLRVGLKTNKPSRFKLTATVGRTTVAAGTVVLKGKKRDSAIPLTQPGRRLLTKARQVTIKLTAVVNDASNNKSAASATRKLKR
jgi:plastocyanin